MVERALQNALDQLTRILLAGGLLEELPRATRGYKSCQEGKNHNFGVSYSNDYENKHRKFVGTPPSDLIS
jgi:hypothetical protein